MSDAASHGFLGEEFLTWLWFRTETEGGEFDLGSGRIVGISFDDMLEFAPLEEDETQHTLKKGTPTRSLEARAALKNGHRLRRARLTLGSGERVWSFTLDAPTLGLRGIKLPEDDEDAESAEDRSRDRAANFLDLHDLVGAVYREFLKLRLDPDYLRTHAEHQAAWMAGV